MTFPFYNLLGYHYKCLVSRSVSRYIVHVLHRFSLQSARSRCHVKRHLAVLALKKAFRTQNYIYPFQNLSLGFILKIFLKCHPVWQYVIWGIMKEVKMLSLADVVNMFLRLIKTPTFLDAFLHISPICLLKFKLSSMVTPNNFISKWLSIYHCSLHQFSSVYFYASTRDSSTEIFHDYTWVDSPYTSLKFPSPHVSKYSQRLRFFPREYKLDDHLHTSLHCTYQLVCYTSGRFGKYSTLKDQS